MKILSLVFDFIENIQTDAAEDFISYYVVIYNATGTNLNTAMGCSQF